MADALTPLTPTDLAFAVFCEQGALALDMFAAMFQQPAAPQRLHTGYMPAAQRREVRARSYSDGLRTPSRRPDSWDRQAARNAKWSSPL